MVVFIRKMLFSCSQFDGIPYIFIQYFLLTVLDLLLGRNPELISGLVGGEYQSLATLAGGCRERIRGGLGGLGVGEGPDGGGLGVGDGPDGLIIKYYIIKVQILHKNPLKYASSAEGRRNHYCLFWVGNGYAIMGMQYAYVY